jgi:hypothetical protein
MNLRAVDRPKRLVTAPSLHLEAGLQASGQLHGPDEGERTEIEPVDLETGVSGNQDREVLFESAATDSATTSIVQAGSQRKRKRRVDKEDLTSTPAKPRKQQYKCEHGRKKSRCKQCGGAYICEHGREKSKCKQCGGASICEHGRIKSHCKQCGGASICEHGRQKSTCKQCGGASFCEHGRIKSKCKQCGGASICEHGRIKTQCKQCGGSAICSHGRIKYRCKDCRALGAPCTPV